jgi:hypothetical protein
MGPGIAAEPHCAEPGICRSSFRSGLPPEGRSPAICDPRSPAQASRRSRSAARSPGLLPRISAPVHLAAPLCLHPALPKLPGSASAGPKTLAPSPFRSCGPGPFLRFISAHSLAEASSSSLGPVLDPPSLLRPGKPGLNSVGHRPSVRGPSWDDRPSRCPDLPLRAGPACGGETIISSGASCRLRSEDPLATPIGHPGEARPS